MADDTLFPVEEIPTNEPPKLTKNKRVWDKLNREVDRLVDLCDHPFDAEGVWMTATPGFWSPGPDGRPRAVGLSVQTCPSCRPLVEKAMDAAVGDHESYFPGSANR